MALRELNQRRQGEQQVTLLWDDQDDVIVLRITEDGQGEVAAMRIPKAEAAAAFRHPFSYMAYKDKEVVG